MSSIPRTDLLAKLVGAYREEAKAATPNNDLISRKEQRWMSGWAQSVAERLRAEKGKHARITVDEYVDAHAGKISRALYAIDKDRNGHIDETEARSLRVTELRTRVADAIVQQDIGPAHIMPEFHEVRDLIAAAQPAFEELDEHESPTGVWANVYPAHYTMEDVIRAETTDPDPNGHEPRPSYLVGEDNGYNAMNAIPDALYSRDDWGLTYESYRQLEKLGGAIDIMYHGSVFDEVELFTARESAAYWDTDYKVVIGRNWRGEWYTVGMFVASEN